MNASPVVVLALLAGVALWQEPPVTLAERERIQDWLTCHDCPSGERAAVVALAGRKPVGTVRLLREALLVGPSSAARTAESLAVLHALLRDSADAPIMGLPLPGVPTDRAAGGFVTRSARLQAIRAAVALGWINTPPARAVLNEAWARLQDPRTRRWVRFALDSLPPPRGP